jgi:transcriptional regulator with GAF, ATPase, and Fis domain
MARLVGHGTAMVDLRRQIGEMAAANSTILIRGETGTGKGLIASLLHERSPRARECFVHVDCTSMAPALVESELFGHERGSFTGALRQHRGRFELAGEGTIFLDEIGDMQPALQVKLLRVLQDRTYERVGGSKPLAMNARVIAATHCDLERSIETGRFRADLYYRLRVLELWAPPLRRRPGDIQPLAEHFLARLAESGHPTAIARDPTDGFFERLREHAWPGNVRELQNLLEQAVVSARGGPLDAALIDRLLRRVHHVPPSEGWPTVPPGNIATVRGALEPTTVARALRSNDWNISETARQLRLPRSTLRYHIARLGLARRP